MANYLSDRIKEALTPEEVARRYGFEPNRSGFICCPFHDGDRSASLKLYKRNWHCFGCGKGGSVIDFAQELFGLSNKAAMERLNTDFGLGLTSEAETKAERSERVKAAERAKKELDAYRASYDAKCAEYRRLWRAKKYKAPKSYDALPDAEYVEACEKLDALDYWFSLHPWR